MPPPPTRSSPLQRAVSALERPAGTTQRLKEQVPGTWIGDVQIEQHRHAVKVALPETTTGGLGSQPATPQLNFSSPDELQRDVDATCTMSKGSKGWVSAVLGLNLALETHVANCQPGAPVSKYQCDFIQRALADKLGPKLAALKKGDKQGGASQLRQRCAIAKGRVTVRYADLDGATQLLQALAQQNAPNPKVVLRLSPDGIAWRMHKDAAADGGEPSASGGAAEGSAEPGTTTGKGGKGGANAKAAAASDPAAVFRPVVGSECAAEFEVNMDVRGVMVDPRRWFSLDGPDDFLSRLSALSLELTREWDTAGLRVPLSGDKPALALELAFQLMNTLARAGHGAVAIVRFDEDSLVPGSACKAVTMTLAETDIACRGLLLRNSPPVVSDVLRQARGVPQEKRAALTRRFDQILSATADVLFVSGTEEMEKLAFNGLVERVVSHTARSTSSAFNRGSMLSDLMVDMEEPATVGGGSGSSGGGSYSNGSH
ncbi:hypothetical protein FOA52_015576 [Chlamydomonas sp. UWO 241]|nr:hypothetical protein FOA52_015576 [Chlamydomonas sp. UWO 241]